MALLKKFTKQFSILIIILILNIVLKTLNSSFAQGNRLWAIYYGETGDGDRGYSVATDAAANVYLAGITRSDSGIASGDFQNFFSGAYDAYIISLMHICQITITKMMYFYLLLMAFKTLI